jgi:leucyl-tRNA synthetase
VNWCPALGTVLANEEVIDGKSEVGGHPVERRNLRQWILRITAYAEKLLQGLDTVDWPDSTKTQQKNWIGRSTGAEVTFDLVGHDAQLRVYTTRPDTLFGVTYMVISPEHPLADTLVTEENREAFEAYRKIASTKSDLDRTELAKDKTGVPTGAFAINPVNGKEVPVWVADYVLMSYGTGAIMAVPGQDERDWEFAEKFGLPIIRTVQPPADFDGKAFTGEGVAMNSDFLDGLEIPQAKKKIIAWLEEKGRGEAKVNYKLRDWLFSRQRYWGEPFPILWVEEAAYEQAKAANSVVSAGIPDEPITYSDGGKTFFALPIPEPQLPVGLPEIASYKPAGDGQSPLATEETWVDVWFNLETGETVSRTEAQPSEGTWVEAFRETNTMPQWAGSCWYYLRYCDPQNAEALIGDAARDYWGSPDFYMGGKEHAVLHLLYARFWHQFLVDLGVLKEAEPFAKLFHQGIILGEDGEKMSKSRGNTVNPDDYISSYGTDALRTYLMFMGPLEDMKPWNSKGIEGVSRFLRKAWREITGETSGVGPKVQSEQAEDAETLKLLHATIKKVTEDIEGIRYNTAISALMVFMNHVGKAESLHINSAKAFVQLVAPFAPHLGEELWARLGGDGSVAMAPWPKFDPELLVSDTVKIGLLINGKPRGEAEVSKDATQDEVLQIAQSDPKVAAHLEGKTIRKIIYVPGKILNLVAN